MAAQDVNNPSGWSASSAAPKRGMPGAMKLVLAVCVVGAAGAAFVSMRGCENGKQIAQPFDPHAPVPVQIGGKEFLLDPAFDDQSRFVGLGGRQVIPERGGMLFIFPSANVHQFVMRDCPIPIDIAFLDDRGHILTMYEMQVEAPKAVDETDIAYESRLKKYSSRYPTRVVVELAAGTYKKLGVKEGDTIGFDLGLLKRVGSEELTRLQREAAERARMRQQGLKPATK